MGTFDDLGAIPSGEPPTLSPGAAPAGAVDFSDLGAVPGEEAHPNMAPTKAVVKSNMAAAAEAKAAKSPEQEQKIKGMNPDQHEASSYVDDFLAGWQTSTLGLGVRGKMPDTVLPEHQDRAARILSMVGTFAGDIPAIVAGGALGGALGGEIAGPKGAVVGATTGGFALPAAFREALVEHYKNGDIQTFSDFYDRTSAIIHQTIKAGATGFLVGAAGAGVGSALPAAASPLLKLGATTAAEAAVMTGVGAAMDGKVPNASEFVDNAIFMTMMHGVFKGAKKAGLNQVVNDFVGEPLSRAIDTTKSKLMDIYAKTGIKPHEMSEMANNDPSLRAEVLSSNPEIPSQLQDAKDPNAAPDPHTGTLKTPDVAIGGEQVGKDGSEVKVEPLSAEEEKAVTEKEGEPPQRSEAVNTVLKTIGEQPDAPKEKLDFNKVYSSVIDENDPLKQIVKAVRGQGAIGGKDDPYALIRSIMSVARKADVVIESGPRDFNDPAQKTGTPGLKQIWEKVDDSAAYIAYRKALHSIDLEKNGIESGVDVEAAKKVVAELGPKYKDIAKEEVKFNNDNIDYLADSGVLSKESAAKMKDLWQNYVAMNRVLEPEDVSTNVQRGGGGADPRNPIKTIKGSDKQTIDPRISAIKNTHAILAMAERNRVASALGKVIDEAVADGNESFGKRIPTPLKAIDVSTEEVAKILKAAGADPEDAKNISGAMTLFRADKQPLADDQFSMYENGKKVVYGEVPKEIVSTMRNMDSKQIGLLLKMLSGPSKLIREGMLNSPMFGARHFIRQEVMNFATAQDLHVPVLVTAKGMSAMFGEEGSPGREAFENWIMHGGGGDSVGAIDKDYIQSKIFDLDEKTGTLDYWNKVKTAAQFTKHFIELTDEARTFQKNENRLAVVKDPWKAQFDSRDSSIDVQRKGAAITAYAMLDPFQNIRIQGVDLLARRLKEDPVGVSAKLFATVTIPSMLIWWAYHDQDWYKNLTRADRDTNFVFAVGDPEKGGHIIRVPKPFEPGVVMGALPERLMDAFFTDNPHAFKDFSKTITDSIMPGYVPTFAAPAIEQFANRSLYSGSQLIPGHMEKVLPELQYRPYTSTTAKVIASGLRLIPSDLTQKPGSLGSPAIVDNYIQNWTGGSGQLAVKAMDTALEKSGVADAFGVDWNKYKPESTWADNPFLKSFVVRYPSVSNKPISDFFDRYSTSEARLNTMTLAARTLNLPEFQKQMSEGMANNQLIKLQGFKQTISQGMQAIDGITRAPGIDKNQKRQLIDQYYSGITHAAEQANKFMDDLERSQKRRGAK